MLAPGSVGRIFENLDEIEAIRYRLSDETAARSGDGQGRVFDGRNGRYGPDGRCPGHAF
ncbi:MAG: hypothetical protein Q7J24_05425 [Desulfomicrobium sp.]|nr:hypothetical protein [Desulfomicrobium sp.]